jgi:predicted nuclease with TOPRIM domain
MRERLQERLEELRRELIAGETRLRELEAEEAGLRETLLRISGAAQVVRELLEEVGEPAASRSGLRPAS